MVEERQLSVSELTEYIKACLEETFGRLAVEGEVSNYRPSSTGHAYFTLKDSGASISAVMFKNRLRYLNFEPKDGMLVRVKGNLSVYAQRGSYQLVCESMEQAGTGNILILLEERKRRLAAEGLFDQDKKKPIPRFPQCVAVVSSPTGAALRDILTILERRARGIRIIVLPTPVQGSEAGDTIARRIEQANQWKLAEVLIVGRGGGSLEDLLPFSEEAVVRAIGASEIPVISAVGHEIDWALSDFAADLRAPTPSAAAELVSAGRAETADRIGELQSQLVQNLRFRIERARLTAKPFSADTLELRFRSILQPYLIRFDDAKEAILWGMQEKIKEGRRRTELALRGLEASSPLSILERGYSVVADAGTGKLIRSADDAVPGGRLRIRPLRGWIEATVDAAHPQEEA